LTEVYIQYQPILIIKAKNYCCHPITIIVLICFPYLLTYAFYNNILSS